MLTEKMTDLEVLRLFGANEHSRVLFEESIVNAVKEHDITKPDAQILINNLSATIVHLRQKLDTIIG